MQKLMENGSLFDVYQSLFEYNHDACYALDLDGNFTLCNESFTEITGYSKEEVLNMTYFPLIPDYSAKNTYCFFDSILQGNREKFTTSIIQKSGNKIDLSITGLPIYINGRINGIVGMAKDITEKNKLSSLLKGQNGILEMVTKGALFHDVLDHILYLVEKVSNGIMGSIHLLDRSTPRLILGAGPNFPAQYREFIKEIPVGPRSGSCGTAAFTKESVLVTDIANDSIWKDYKENALKHGLKACWSTPVFDNQTNVLGVLALYYDKKCIPTEWDKQVVREATYLTSLVIQHYYSEERINFLAFHEDLTGLPNRRMFDERVYTALQNHKKNQHHLGIMYLDLDRFKLINDSLGHNIGDLLLKEVAKRLNYCVKNSDTVSRQGGDEFTILLQNTSQLELGKTAEKILVELANPYHIGGHEVFVTPSIGIGVYPLDGKNGDELLRKADAAMYEAKKKGRNNYQFYNPALHQKTRERLEIENELRKALEKKEFKLGYQPIVDLSTGQLASVEALIRWDHPFLGAVSPAQFIPIAEETGIIVPLGEWVLRTACQQLGKWKREGLQIPSVSVNISIRQFFQPNLIPMIAHILKESDINPACLTIEITESMTMDVDVAATILYDLKRLGVNISIDDFGTGYSSLNYLKTFPIDFLKIDQSFIRDITKSKNDEKIAVTILLMARNLGLGVIAEGVEMDGQLDVLLQYDCDQAQGYLFSKPLTPEQLREYIS